MKNHKTYLWPLILATALAVGVVIGGKLRFSNTPEDFFTTDSNKAKLNRLIDYIEYEYVDQVNTDSIVDLTVNNILERLNPHSVYIPKEQAQQVAENMQGDFVGIGISFYMYKDSLSVIRPLEGGPSMPAGILPGDRILMADGDTLYGKGMESEAVVKKLKGLPNTSINLKVHRKGSPNLLDFTINRSKVPIKSVDGYYMLTQDLGYIKINRFAESTYKEFMNALNALKNKGMSQLVLDLRDNPGGYLNIAEQIADEFLADKKLILYTKNKKGSIEKTFATKKGAFENNHVYVLINEKSASASEIIAGALQDNDQGTIVGRRSFGKGLVQREMPLPDGSAVRLTISRYYTPTGRSIQRSYENGTKNYYEDYLKRFESGELQSIDSIKVADSLKFKTPKGKIVYGGGGIIPDVFIPLTASIEDETVTYILRSGLASFFIFEHLDSDRNQYQDYDEDHFITTYEVPESLIQNFNQYLAQRRLKIDLNIYHSEIAKYLKANIAEQLFGENAYERIVNKDDNALSKVIMLSTSH